MSSLTSLIAQLRPLIHPMLVHFPIALLFASVALDWIGYVLRHPNLTRAGFYTLALGAFAAGIAALSGPDHATGDPSVPALLAAHQTWAGVTVGLAVGLVAVRFVATRGLRGSWAPLYLLATLALLAAVSLTGYFGGEMTYHHAVGVSAANVTAVPASDGTAYVAPLIPAKPFVAVVGLLAVVGLGLWLGLGRQVFPRYYPQWWRAVREELANAGAPLWTLQRGGTVRPATGTATGTATAAAPAWQAPYQQAPSIVPPAQAGQANPARPTWPAKNDPRATDDDWMRARPPRRG
jgi:uncharacterized membrane protein